MSDLVELLQTLLAGLDLPRLDRLTHPRDHHATGEKLMHKPEPLVTIGGVVDKSEARLLCYPGYDRTSLLRLRRWLDEHDLRLRPQYWRRQPWHGRVLGNDTLEWCPVGALIATVHPKGSPKRTYIVNQIGAIYGATVLTGELPRAIGETIDHLDLDLYSSLRKAMNACEQHAAHALRAELELSGSENGPQ